MKLYLDTADASQWQLPAGCAPVQGATTNPTLVHAACLPVSLDAYLNLVQQAGKQGLPELMLQLPTPDTVQAQRWVSALHSPAQATGLQLTIKLPCHPDWQGTLAYVQALGVPTLLTGVSNAMQLLWAQEHKATYVAPYIGRLQADGRDVWPFLQACVAVQQAGGPRLLAASIKSADVFTRLLALGAYAVTVRPDFASSLALDPITLAAMAQFDTDTLASQSHMV